MKKLFISFAFCLFFGQINSIAQDSHNIVSASDAHQLMGAYQLWETLLPDSIVWNPDNSTITYFKKQLNPAKNYENQAIIKLNQIVPAHDSMMRASGIVSATDTLPIPLHYSYSKNLVQSYYFSKADLDTIDTLMKQQFDGVAYTGYRAYMAFQPYPCENEDDVRSHIYLGPATKISGEYETIFKDFPISDSIPNTGNFGPVYLDLTLPCPAGCTESFGHQIPAVGDPCIINHNESKLED
jgi:hypothetical protein